MPQILLYTINGAAGDDGAAGADGADGADGNTVPGGRLTLATGDSLPTADQTAKTTVYYTPHLHAFISLWNSGDGEWQQVEFTEKSVAVPSTTTTPFDVFGNLSAGDLALSTVNWTNDTTRAPAIARHAGYGTKSDDVTKLYLGTCRTTGTSGNCEDSVTNRFVWNMFNQEVRSFRKAHTGSGYTYSTATYRQTNNDSANQVNFVVGLAGGYLEVDSLQLLSSTVADSNAHCGVGLDSTSVNAGVAMIVCNSTALVMCVGHLATIITAVGMHSAVGLERGAGSGTQTWFSSGADRGMLGYFMA